MTIALWIVGYCIVGVATGFSYAWVHRNEAVSSLGGGGEVPLISLFWPIVWVWFTLCVAAGFYIALIESAVLWLEKRSRARL